MHVHHAGLPPEFRLHILVDGEIPHDESSTETNQRASLALPEHGTARRRSPIGP